MIPPEVETTPDVAALKEFDPQAITAAKFDRGELTLWIEAPRIVPACEFLKVKRQYRYMSCLTAVDWYPAEPRFEVVYHLYAHAHHQRLRLKAKLYGENPAIASVTPVWRAANWFEREVFDLFGIRFEGHPNLTRILMPDDWQGHPLRKDYPVTGYR
ncbi:MAG: NADH-quinone oxidoreductase subunit C [Acidobacteria bacterium]|nr:NADH-quinone oxidoreductase subunit C [Acidobacteriota bacterium]